MPTSRLKWNRVQQAKVFISVYYIIKGDFLGGEESTSKDEINEVRHILVAKQKPLHKDMVLQKSESVLLNKNINYVFFFGTEQCGVIIQNVLCVMSFPLLSRWVCTKTATVEIRALESWASTINGHMIWVYIYLNLNCFSLTKKYWIRNQTIKSLHYTF